VSPSDLEDQILDADASGNKLRVDALLLGAIKNLKSNKAKPDTIMIVNLIYLAKSRPEFFLSNRVVEVSETLIRLFNKLTSVFRASVLLLIINFVMTLSK